MKPTVNRALKAMVKATVIAGMLGLFAAGAANAQSSVQLYGQVDEWVGATKFPGSDRAWNVSGGGMSAGLPRGAPLSAHHAILATSSSLSEMSFLYCWMPMPFSMNHGGIVPCLLRMLVRRLIAAA